MKKERMEALEKLNDLLESCKTCKIIENQSQQNRETYCLKKCSLAHEMKKIREVLNSTLRERIYQEEEEKPRSRKVPLGKFSWNNEAYEFLIQLKRRGIIYEEIAKEMTKKYKREFTVYSVKHKANDLRKAGRL